MWQFALVLLWELRMCYMRCKYENWDGEPKGKCPPLCPHESTVCPKCEYEDYDDNFDNGCPNCGNKDGLDGLST